MAIITKPRYMNLRFKSFCLQYINFKIRISKPWTRQNLTFADIQKIWNRDSQFLNAANIARRLILGMGKHYKKALSSNKQTAAICEKTGTREWDKTDTPPTTITLETIRTSAAIFRRVGICA
jgi:hypothetical protein